MAEAFGFCAENILTRDHFIEVLNARFGKVGAQMDARFAEQDVEFDKRFAEQDGRFSKIELGIGSREKRMGRVG